MKKLFYLFIIFVAACGGESKLPESTDNNEITNEQSALVTPPQEEVNPPPAPETLPDISERAEVRSGVVSWIKNADSTVTVTRDAYVLPLGNLAVDSLAVYVDNISCTFTVHDGTTDVQFDSATVNILSKSVGVQYQTNHVLGGDFYSGGYPSDISRLYWAENGTSTNRVWFEITYFNVSDLSGLRSKYQCTFDDALL